MAKQLETFSECESIQFVLDIPKVAKATLSEIREGYPKLGDEFEVRWFELEAVGIREEYVKGLADKRLIRIEQKGSLGQEFIRLEEATLTYIIKRNPVLKLTSGKNIPWDEQIAGSVRGIIEQELLKVKDQETFAKAGKKRGWTPNWFQNLK